MRVYKDLSKVERAFRSLKSVDLKVRPLHHRRADRVRAHVLLCVLAYYVEWHMRRALAPLLFDDNDPAAAEQQRPSVVAAARRSPAAPGQGRKRRLQPAAWMSTRLRTFSWPRTHTRRRPPGFILMRERPLHQLATPPL